MFKFLFLPTVVQRFIALALLLASLFAQAQISFEKGYFIDNLGKKTECLIKNLDWNNNPREFRYKLTDNSEEQTATLMYVTEFGVDGVSKYEKHRVTVDRSKGYGSIDGLSNSREPKFEEEEHFLKALIEGKATLYAFYDGNLSLFFYKTDTSGAEPLIFKNYLVSSGRKAENNSFRQQLWGDLQCQGISLAQVEKLRYTAKALINFFMQYNECENAETSLFGKELKKKTIHLTLRPGTTSSSLTIDNSVLTWRAMDFGSKTGARLGLEAEYVLPFNKDKWSLFAEPTYQYFKAETDLAYLRDSDITTRVNVDYATIDIPVGVRHYMFLSERSKLFLNIAYVFAFPLSGSISGENTNAIDEEVNYNSNWGIGLGYNFDNKYSIECRNDFSRDIVTEGNWFSDYKSISLIFGYSIF